jgi:hypothetical protein
MGRRYDHRRSTADAMAIARVTLDDDEDTRHAVGGPVRLPRLSAGRRKASAPTP